MMRGCCNTIVLPKDVSICRLEREYAGTQYHEGNVATGKVMGNPGFNLPTNTEFQVPVSHGQAPIIAYEAALQTLRKDSSPG